MCGRFVKKGLKYDADGNPEIGGFNDIRIIYRGQGMLRERYNIAPASQISVLRTTDEGVVADDALWWLLPPFVTDAKDWMKKAATFNARSETIATAPSFRSAWKRGKRCLIPADALYEWQKVGTAKKPHAILRRDRAPFAFAGIFEDGSAGLSATIITLEPNALFAPLHNRMAMILPPEDYAAWLSPDTDPDQAMALIRKWDPGEFKAYEVSKHVSNARNEGPGMLGARR